MSVNKTTIEWTDSTWSPVTGCDKVSPGCDNCYAETIAKRFAGTKAYPNGFALQLRPERLDQPLKWRKPRRIFVNSMSDLFHPQIPEGYTRHVFEVMALSKRHTFQVLTKRPGPMKSMLQRWERQRRSNGTSPLDFMPWPIPNVHLGVSCEDQKWAGVRIPILLETPAAVRFISAEPLLGPIDLLGDAEAPGPAIIRTGVHQPGGPWGPDEYDYHDEVGLDWVIVGGESGPHARPMHPDWARGLRDQCQAAGVAFLFKQWGGRTPKAGGRELDGREWNEYPAQEMADAFTD